MNKPNEYQLPLKSKSEKIFNFGGSYWQCQLLDSKDNFVTGLNTQYESRKNNFKIASRKIQNYIQRNPNEFPKVLGEIRKSKHPDNLTRVVKEFSL